MESGSREENPSNEKDKVFHRLHGTVKNSRTYFAASFGAPLLMPSLRNASGCGIAMML